MKSDIQETAQAPGGYLGHAGDWFRVEHAVTDDPERTGPFGHEHVAIREESETPRAGQRIRDDRHANTRRWVDGVELPRTITKGRGLGTEVRSEYDDERKNVPCEFEILHRHEVLSQRLHIALVRSGTLHQRPRSRKRKLQRHFRSRLSIRSTRI